jgi:hypothetical protein
LSPGREKIAQDGEEHSQGDKPLLTVNHVKRRVTARSREDQLPEKIVVVPRIAVTRCVEVIVQLARFVLLPRVGSLKRRHRKGVIAAK